MSKWEKLLDRMRENPRDWRIEDVKTLAGRFKIAYKQPGTSHVTFRSAKGIKVTIPAHKPIKPIYIKQFVALIDDLKGESDEH